MAKHIPKYESVRAIEHYAVSKYVDILVKKKADSAKNNWEGPNP